MRGHTSQFNLCFHFPGQDRAGKKCSSKWGGTICIKNHWGFPSFPETAGVFFRWQKYRSLIPLITATNPPCPLCHWWEFSSPSLISLEIILFIVFHMPSTQVCLLLLFHNSFLTVWIQISSCSSQSGILLLQVRNCWHQDKTWWTWEEVFWLGNSYLTSSRREKIFLLPVENFCEW